MSAFYAVSNDTTIVDPNVICCEYDIMAIAFDWKIYIPAKNKLVSISNINSPQTESRCWKCGCWNPINSYSLDGQPKILEYRAGDQHHSSGYVAFIQN